MTETASVTKTKTPTPFILTGTWPRLYSRDCVRLCMAGDDGGPRDHFATVRVPHNGVDPVMVDVYRTAGHSAAGVAQALLAALKGCPDVCDTWMIERTHMVGGRGEAVNLEFVWRLAGGEVARPLDTKGVGELMVRACEGVEYVQEVAPAAAVSDPKPKADAKAYLSDPDRLELIEDCKEAGIKFHPMNKASTLMQLLANHRKGP